MRTILCDNHQKTRIYHQILKDQGTNALRDVALLTLSNLLKTDEKEDAVSFPIRLAHLLQANREKFPIYQDMFIYPAFIQEILSFSKECALYGIRADDLPDSTQSDRELKGILSLALQLPLREKTLADQYRSLLAKARSIDEIECRIRFEADPFRNRFLHELSSGHPNFINGVQLTKPETVTVRYATNVRQEMEAVAQEICRRNEPCAVVLCQYSSVLPVAEQVFSRYQIPYSSLAAPAVSTAVRAYCALGYTALYKDVPSLVKALEAEAFSIPCKEPLLSWLKQTLTGLNYTPVSEAIVSDLLKSDAACAKHMDDEAVKYFQAIQKELDQLIGAGTPGEALQAAWSVLRSSPSVNSKNETIAALGIMRVLNQTLNEIKEENDAVFILRQIESLPIQEELDGPSFCTVTDLRHPCANVKTLYVLGCSAKNYPAAPVRKGLFDEAYTAAVSKFPSLSQRHALYLHELSWLQEVSRHVVYSYSRSDYQGKEIQPAFEITSKYGTGQPWTFDQVKPKEPSIHTITPDTAYRLYVQPDGRVHSSISRIERYFYCPYSWFVQSGLKIRKPMHADLDAATIGNIQHAFMEYAVNAYHKEYAERTNDEVADFLKPAFDSLRSLHPNRITEIDLCEQRMLSGIRNTLYVLSKIERSSPVWKPVEPERKFDEAITEHVQLNGIIDRIDESPSSVRVMDYKSSSKTLSEHKIKAGIQLQLPSYIIIAEALKRKHPAGVYYISMKPDSVSVDAGSFKTANKDGLPMNDVNDPSFLEEAMIEKRRLSGWMFEDSAINDEYYQKYFTPGKGEYDYDLLKECLEELYELFYEKITSGQIEVKPVEGACTFCDYKALCRIHQDAEKVSELVMEGLTFKKGKVA